ncbi:hypothetical protein [Micromonospora sp. CNB394]|uniref:DUF6907 domain-containing protein n=1 Tax=Micromonospora sp. CNB394 TaxID=1169151 RepID=UPI00038013DA|nr:hypothetical protein [Micromonospora sp. CNB394]
MTEPISQAAAGRSQRCPRWCTECRDCDTGPGSLRARMHRGRADTVHLYDEACLRVEAQVRVAFWDKSPDWIGTDPADLERPYVEVSVSSHSGLQLSLSPDQARHLAAALLHAAHAADTAIPNGTTR